MKPITLHPSSLLAGIGLASLAFLAMAQTPQPISPTAVFRSPQPIINARDYVQIRQGTPFVVPPNKIFVVTALGRENNAVYGNGSGSQIFFNGLLMATVISAVGSTYSTPTETQASVVDLPRGLTAVSGTSISVTCSANCSNDAVAWGYLADA